MALHQGLLLVEPYQAGPCQGEPYQVGPYQVAYQAGLCLAACLVRNLQVVHLQAVHLQVMYHQKGIGPRPQLWGWDHTARQSFCGLLIHRDCLLRRSGR